MIEQIARTPERVCVTPEGDMCVCVCVCVCERERETQTDRQAGKAGRDEAIIQYESPFLFRQPSVRIPLQ